MDQGSTGLLTGMAASGLTPTELSWPVPEGVDPERALQWEHFLWSSERGHYQQSLRWAWVKEAEGWRARLETWPQQDSLRGGFLLLVKVTRFGKLGWINKGPVLAEEDPESVRQAMDRMLESAGTERLRALIVQLPDASRITAEDLQRTGFCHSPVPGIIDATLIASLDGGADAIFKRLGPTARTEVRRGRERGVVVEEGRRDDLPVFFELMCHTCRRQGVRPNPASVEAFHRRWEAFGPLMRLILARVEGETVAGLTMLRFGRRCTIEKKGWNERHARAFPNTVLYLESMIRAAEWGCAVMDFGAMDRPLAERMLRGDDVTKELASTRHAFHYRLGGRPVLQAPAQVLVRPGWMRWAVDLVLARPGLSRTLERMVAG